jgi:hypothetical protein
MKYIDRLGFTAERPPRPEPRASASGRWLRVKVTSDSLTLAVPGGISEEPRSGEDPCEVARQST